MSEPQILYSPFSTSPSDVREIVKQMLSEPKVIKIKIIDESIQTELPKYGTEFSSCVDLISSIDCNVEPLTHEIVSTNISVEIPLGYEIQVRPRSGLAAKHKVTVLNTPGTIDSDYRGEIKVILFNHSEVSTFRINKGDRIAQAALVKVERMIFEKVNELSDTIRGSGGFGHTGK